MFDLPPTADLANFYYILTNRYVPGPQSLSYFIAPLLLLVALLIPPSRLSHRALATCFLPPIYACTWHAWTISGVEVLSTTTALWAGALLLWRDSRTLVRVRYATKIEHGAENHHQHHGYELRRRHGKTVTEGSIYPEEAYPAPLLKRLQWVCTLLVSLRLYGWKEADEAFQPAPKRSRANFARNALKIVLADFLLLDATFWYVQYDPYFTTAGMGIDRPFPINTLPPPTFVQFLWILPPRLLRCVILAAQIFAMVSGMFYLPIFPAAAFNALGLLPDEWSPHTWPPVFGDFWAISRCGLRGLWSKWWHQINRKFVSALGKSVCEAWNLPKGSPLSYAILVSTSFFFSGVLHMGLIPPMPVSETLTANQMRLSVGSFFWVQMLAFAVEMIVEHLISRYLPQLRQIPGIGLIMLGWTSAWLCIVLPLLAEPFREIGYWHASPLGPGILRPLIEFMRR